MNFIIDPFTNNKHSINSNYGINLLKKYIIKYQSGGSGKSTKVSGSESGVTKSKTSGSGATKSKASERNMEEVVGTVSTTPKTVTLVGPNICYIYKISDKTIILFGETHAKISKITNGLFYHEYILSLLDKFKTQNKCLDIYHEYEYPIAKLQEQNRSPPKSISNSCAVDYSSNDQYIVWIDNFYNECIVNKKRVRLHSFDLRKIFENREDNYMLNDLFYGYVGNNSNYKDTFKIFGLEEFDEKNTTIGFGPFAVKTTSGKYFENKSIIDPLRNSFIETLNGTTFNKPLIMNIIENFLELKNDNLLLEKMFKLLDKSHELLLITSTFDKSKHKEAITIIHKQIKKTKFGTNMKLLVNYLTDSFIEYFENLPEEDTTRTNLMEKVNDQDQSERSFGKIKMIILIYLHILTDVYAFLRMVLSWSKEPKLLRKPGCTGDNYEQKNIIFYGGSNHTYLLSIFLGKYHKKTPVIISNPGKYHIDDFPLDIF